MFEIADLDLSGVDPTQVQAVAEANGMIPPGKYHVVVEGVAPKQVPNGSATEIEFKLLTGPFAGKTVKDTVWNPSDSQDPEKKKTTMNRLCLFGHRLGLLEHDSASNRYKPVAGKTSFAQCVGAQAVIELVHRKYKKQDGTEGMAVNVPFGGIWKLDDAKVKDVPKANTPAVAAAETAKPKSRVSDL